MKLLRFHRLVRRYRSRIFAHAYAVLGNRQDAEDVLQETLLRLWLALDREKIEKEGAWLMRVAHNLCVDLLRRKSIPVREGDGSEEEKIFQETDPSADPQLQVERMELSERVAAALRGLPELPRAVTILREIDGLSYREIGRVLNIPVNSVKVYLYRGRKRLREQLASYFTEEGEGKK